MREVLIRPRAQLDIESIYIYIAYERKEPKAAQEVLDALYDAFDRAAELPGLGRAFEDADLERSYRRMLVGCYWVYYTYDDESVTIWRIFHVRRDIDSYTIVDL